MQDHPPSQDPAELRTALAEDRTDWAEDRTLQANERTFAGWMRTGLAAIGVALGLKAVFGSFDPTWAAKAVATVFVLAALGIFWSAERNASRTHRRLSEHAAQTQNPVAFRWISIVMGLGAVAAAAILWSL